MTGEELEFQISQYVDGTLSNSQREIVETLLENDPAAQKF